MTDAGNHTSNTATVSITIAPVNDDTPVAVADNITVAEGGTVSSLVGGNLSVLANDTDADLPNDTLTAVLVAGPAHGNLTLNGNGTFSYTHDDSEILTDSFTYQVTDAGNHTSNTATVSITITPVNDNTPVANADSITVAEGGTASSLAGGNLSVLANDTDTDLPNDTLTAVLVAGPAHGNLSLNGNGTFSYTHDDSEVFTDSFTYQVTDAGNHTSNAATVSITITPVNDNTPVAVADSITVAEGGTASSLVGGNLSVLVNDTDTDLPNDTLTAVLVAGPAHGNLTLNGNGTFSYTHDNSEVLTDTFTYQVTDAGNHTSNTATVSITITPVNDNTPVANADSIAVAEGGTASSLVGGNLSVLANDTDTDLPNDTLTAVLVAGPAHGNLTLNGNGTFSYTHDDSEVSTDSFTYQVTDAGNHTSNTATVSITIAPVNDNTPVANADSITVAEGGTASSLVGGNLSVLANDTDTDLPNDTLTAVLVAGPAHGNLTLNGNGTLSYTHDNSEIFTDSFTYQVTDAGNHTSNTATVSITIAPVNDNTPVANADSITVAEGGTASSLVGGNLSVLANDTDTDLPNDTLTAVLVAGPAHGNLTLNGNGTFSYTHDDSEILTDSFTYQVTDAGNHTSGNTTVSITITPVNDNTPVANADSITVAEGGTATVLNSTATSVLTNDTDTDLPGDTLTAVLVSGAAHGNLTLNGNGTFSYTHDNSEVFTDSFTYQVTDAGNHTSGNTTVSITITPVNDNTPVANADSITVAEGGTATVLNFTATSVLANDTDTDLPNDSLTAVLVSGPAHGNLTLNGNGTFSYTHDGSAFFSDSFTYHVTDAGNHTSGNTTVSITIAGVNDAAHGRRPKRNHGRGHRRYDHAQRRRRRSRGDAEPELHRQQLADQWSTLSAGKWWRSRRPDHPCGHAGQRFLGPRHLRAELQRERQPVRHIPVHRDRRWPDGQRPRSPDLRGGHRHRERYGSQ